MNITTYHKFSATVFLFQLAQPIRLALSYVGEDFEDKYYEVGPGLLSFIVLLINSFKFMMSELFIFVLYNYLSGISDYKIKFFMF